MFNFLFKNRSDESRTLFYKTDIHCHIIPGVDHGAQTPEDSLALLDAEKRWGIERIVLTSHVTENTFENTPESLSSGFRNLLAALKDAGRENEFSLAFSAEYRIDSLFLEQLEKGIITPFPDGHLLIENSFLQEPIGLDNLIFRLQTLGYTLILAHPERYTYYYNNFNRFINLHERGVEFQTNLLSLSGYHGKDVRQMAEKFAKEGLIDYLGSDLHHPRHVEAIDSFISSKSYTKLLPALQQTVKNDTITF